MTKLIAFMLPLILGPGANAAKSNVNPVPAEPRIFIGDSHTVGTFGETLAKEMPELIRYAVSASAANDWLPGIFCPSTETCPFSYGYATPEGSFEGTPPENFPGFPEILAASPAKTVVIALGTNDANQRCHQKRKQAYAPVLDLLKLAKGRACYWVGPPTYTKGPVIDRCGRDYKKFVDGLKKTVTAAGCRYIDSRTFIDPATRRPIEANDPDEIHFIRELGELWADQVRAAIQK